MPGAGGVADVVCAKSEALDPRECLRICESGPARRRPHPRAPQGVESGRGRHSDAVEGGDNGVAGADQRPGGFGDLAEHGVDVEPCTDARDGVGERGSSLAPGRDLPVLVAGPAVPFGIRTAPVFDERTAYPVWLLPSVVYDNNIVSTVIDMLMLLKSVQKGHIMLSVDVTHANGTA